MVCERVTAGSAVCDIQLNQLRIESRPAMSTNARASRDASPSGPGSGNRHHSNFARSMIARPR
jgi:hypothetical protein